MNDVPVAPETGNLILSPYSYLEGPKSRSSELGFTIKVMLQFLKGFRKLHFVGHCVTVFGSARYDPGHQYYELAREAGKTIARMGLTVLTGGGPGIMEGANRGAFEVGGESIGCNIKLPKEQKPNPYLHDWICLDHFFVRKVLLLKYSYAFFVLPGGWGTMDELFETLTLVQTGIIHNFPIVIMGSEYYSPLRAWIERMVSEETISASDLRYLLHTDDLEEASSHIEKFIQSNYRIKERRLRRWWLGEHYTTPVKPGESVG